eukprot:scaffold689_cov333-Pavlova_lutheri.AAC.1
MERVTACLIHQCAYPHASFLDEVLERHAPSHVLLGDGDHQPEVGTDHVVFGAPAPFHSLHEHGHGEPGGVRPFLGGGSPLEIDVQVVPHPFQHEQVLDFLGELDLLLAVEQVVLSDVFEVDPHEVEPFFFLSCVLSVSWRGVARGRTVRDVGLGGGSHVSNPPGRRHSLSDGGVPLLPPCVSSLHHLLVVGVDPYPHGLGRGRSALLAPPLVHPFFLPRAFQSLQVLVRRELLLFQRLCFCGQCGGFGRQLGHFSRLCRQRAGGGRVSRVHHVCREQFPRVGGQGARRCAQHALRLRSLHLRTRRRSFRGRTGRSRSQDRSSVCLSFHALHPRSLPSFSCASDPRGEAREAAHVAAMDVVACVSRVHHVRAPTSGEPPRVPTRNAGVRGAGSGYGR